MAIVDWGRPESKVIGILIRHTERAACGDMGGGWSIV